MMDLRRSLKYTRLRSREVLAKLMGEAGLKKGAEIGVLKGQYSKILCANIPGIRLICVDPWKPCIHHRDAEKMEGYYIHTQRRLSRWDVTIMRMTSLEAAKHIANESLDFVYIDALHDEENVTNDLNAWIPKVRPGGLVSGHDWGAIGVTKAVLKYLDPHPEIELFTTLPCPQDWFQSWAFVKQ